MKDFENIYEKLHELFGVTTDKLNILQETIDLSVQVEYFEAAERIKINLNEEEVIKQAEKLYDPDIDLKYKKELLSGMASIDNVQAYRIIEKYMENPDPSLKEWGTLALQENRMILESKLLDENQIFISTGLGGKGLKLRYFVVIFGKNSKQKLNATQKKVITNEFDATLKKYHAEIEEINFSGHIATLMTVVPMNVVLKKLFDEAILECNQFGDFLFPNFFITNVKALQFKEIIQLLNKQKESEKS